MTGVVVNEVRRGFYLDSVALMRLSRRLAGMAGVEEAALMMGTPANRRIMSDAGLLGPECAPTKGGDLIIGIRATSAAAAQAACMEAARLLDRPAAAGDDSPSWRPRSIRAAIRAMPDANLALISVPGAFAAAEARKALRRGLHVMVFSDNVPVEDEVALKQEARARGLLVMGPDCGTAILGGVPLAFANKVPRGDIAIVGASGSGIQEVSCLIARGGGGISQAIGVGGRDLSQAVGGITTLMALEALEADPETRHIVIVSKPPAPAVAVRIAQFIGASRKSFTVCFIGAEVPALPANARPAATLKQAAEASLGGKPLGGGGEPAPAIALPGGRRWVRGLFSGGLLAAEAQVIFHGGDEAVSSNVPIPGAARLADGGAGHRMIDLGSDEYTIGRPHPMIDPSVRDDALHAALADPSVGIVIVDMVLGFGAHDDPAGHIVRSLHGRTKDLPVIIASVTGTDEDPQGRMHQVATLREAGIRVAPSNADAASFALACIGGASQ